MLLHNDVKNIILDYYWSLKMYELRQAMHTEIRKKRLNLETICFFNVIRDNFSMNYNELVMRIVRHYRSLPEL